MELTADVYAWLASTDIFESFNANFTVNDKGNVEVDEEVSGKIKNGVFS
jgi:hypothetical protein